MLGIISINMVLTSTAITQNNIVISEKSVITRPSNYLRVKGDSTVRNVSYYQVQNNGMWIANANENYGSFMIDFKYLSQNKVFENVKIVAYNYEHKKIAESNSFKITLDQNYEGSVVEDEYIEPDGINRARKSISVYTKGRYHITTLEESMRQVREFDVGIEEIIISIGIANNCETNDPQANLTKDEINRLVNYAESVGYKKITLKCHSAGEYDGLGNQSMPTNPALWHERYKNIVDVISDVAVEQGHKDFIISNELGNITNFASNKVYWQDIIELVKAKDLRVGSSVNYPELVQNDGYQLFNDLDFIGFNVYPSMTSKDKEWAKSNIDELKKAWYVSDNLIETIPLLKQFKETGKEVWVTEAGCIPTTTGLQYPAYWGDGQTPDDEVQEIYYKAMMPVLASSPYVDVFSIWTGNIDDAFSFMSRPSGEIVKKYWKYNDYTTPEPEPKPENTIEASGSYTANVGDQYVYIDGYSNVDAAYYEVMSPEGWIGVAEFKDNKFKLDISWIKWGSTYTNAKIVAKDQNNNIIAESEGTINLKINIIEASGSYTANVGDQYVYIDGYSNVDAAYYEVMSPEGWIGVAEFKDNKFKLDISWIKWKSTYTNAKIVAKDQNNNIITESKATINLNIN